ncbi:MAG: ABC transporter ATP-binding protein [Candidatus Methanomethylophilaceae archaeon]|nr:ABC transporter ATP-binding protein [Candidatus Methanomethylophilaceae archaeon]
MELAIEAENLTKRYGDFVAVNDLELNVKHGEFMGLLGPNGSGKSTTLKMITGLIWPTSGTVRIFGTDVSQHREALSRVGCVIETPEFYMSFTPSEALQYVGRLYGLSEREIAIRSRDVLEDVKMWEWRDKPIQKFSKGMRQRTVLAQAMLPNPDLLILDEPTSGLDPRGMIEMRSVLSELKKRDMSMLISTHMLKEVSEMCDSVTMIRNGNLIASGDVNELIMRYAEQSKKRIEISIRTMNPIADSVLKDISSCQGVYDIQPMGDYEVRIQFSGSLEDQSVIVDLIQAAGLKMVAMNEKGMDIERLYMELTKGGEANIR